MLSYGSELRLVRVVARVGALVLKEQLDELIEIHAVLRNDTPDRGRVCGIERGKPGVTAEDAKNADPFMRCCQRSALRAYQ